MCLILDTNMYGLFLASDNEDMRPVKDWVDKKNGKIVYSPMGKIEKELKKHGKMYKKFMTYRKAGKLKRIEPVHVEKEKQALSKLKLKSDDPDIIALAQASKVKLLVSGDKKLHADFKEIIKGKVYQKKAHERLLTKNLCL